VFWLSQGSVATLNRWDGWSSYCHMCLSALNLIVKTALKSVDFWQSYTQKWTGSSLTAHGVCVKLYRKKSNRINAVYSLCSAEHRTGSPRPIIDVTEWSMRAHTALLAINAAHISGWSRDTRRPCGGHTASLSSGLRRRRAEVALVNNTSRRG